jgi:hypothetical protein
MRLEELGLAKNSEYGNLGVQYVNTFIAQLFKLFHDQINQFHFKSALDALRFFRSNFPAYLTLHAGFSARNSQFNESDPPFDGIEPETEETENTEQDGTEKSFFPGFNYGDLVKAKYLSAIEALICHPLVAREIEQRARGSVAQVSDIVLEGETDWDINTLNHHLCQICGKCGISEAVKNEAVLVSLTVFSTIDSGEVIGYIDVDIPDIWPSGPTEGEAGEEAPAE